MVLTNKQAEYLFIALNSSNDYLLHMNDKEEIKRWYKDVKYCIMKNGDTTEEESGWGIYHLLKERGFGNLKITNYKKLQEIIKDTDDWRLVDDDGYTIDMYSALSTNVNILGRSRAVNFRSECIEDLKRIFNHNRKKCINETISLIEEEIGRLEKEINELKQTQCLTKFFKENKIELQ